MSITSSESGGVTHYSLIHDSSASALTSPTAGFQSFVRSLNEGPIYTAVALGQFQRVVEHKLRSVAEDRARPPSAAP